MCTEQIAVIDSRFGPTALALSHVCRGKLIPLQPSGDGWDYGRLKWYLTEPSPEMLCLACDLYVLACLYGCRSVCRPSTSSASCACAFCEWVPCLVVSGAHWIAIFHKNYRINVRSRTLAWWLASAEPVHVGSVPRPNEPLQYSEFTMRSDACNVL